MNPVVPQLLAALAQSPDDDVPRLALADEVVDLGFGWGELIRIQCLLARGAPNEAALREEEGRLLQVLEPRLHRAMVPWADHSVVRRGVPEAAWGSAEAMLKRHEGPSTVRTAVLRAGHQQLPLKEVLEHPVVQQLEALSLTVREGAEPGPQLSPAALPRLRWLELVSSSAPQDLVSVLRAFPLAQLTALTVCGSPMFGSPQSAGPLMDLLAAEARPLLRHLNLDGFRVNDAEAVRALLQQAPALETFGFLRTESPEVTAVLQASALSQVEAPLANQWDGGPQLLQANALAAGPWPIESPSRGRRAGPFALRALLDDDGLSAWLSEAKGAPVLVVMRRAAHDGVAGRHGHPQLGPRLLKAARRAQALTHPALLRTLDSGLEGADAWVAVELCDGAPLLALGAEPLSPSKELFELLATAATAADAALACADLSAADLWRRMRRRSVFVERDGVVRLLSEWLPSVSGDAHGASNMVAPPEALTGLGQGAASVAWSLGALTFELLAGAPLVSGRPHEVAGAIFSGELPSLTQAGASVPAALVEMVDALLAKKPQARPSLSSAAALLYALASEAPSGPELKARAGAAIDATPLRRRLALQFGLWPGWRQPEDQGER